MISQLAPMPCLTRGGTRPPTLWGLGPAQLHDRYWAARGVAVVRQGEVVELASDAELYLLIDPRDLVIFRLRGLIEILNWVRPDILFVRVRNQRDRQYRETAVTDAAGQFIRFRRSYGGADARLGRVALTRDPQTARLWQTAGDIHAAWNLVRRHARGGRREVMTIKGRLYDCASPQDMAQHVRELVQLWGSPASTIPNLRRVGPQVWAHRDASVQPDTSFVGPVWVGAGRQLAGRQDVLGPAALWDNPAARTITGELPWGEIEPAEQHVPVRQASVARHPVYQRAKRAFDIVFALLAIAATLPLYPLVCLAIWLEDGRPFFFGHRRETVGGRTFACWKFRSMRKDADRIKAELAARNQADGPQFFMVRDPRLTRVGRWIRKANIDELPQFWNVLTGDMSVVGPRPSPYAENQFCPPWREARLSVPPGITGLWQVKRTRTPGLDFQEWIKYDLEYVERAGWWMDLSIIGRTLLVLLRGSSS